MFLDIDECATGRVSCPRFRQCVNTFGSYICKCHTGFDLMYIGGKYQCHGNETVPCLSLLSSDNIEKSPAVVITGLSGSGESTDFKGAVSASPTRHSGAARTVSLLVIAVLRGPLG